MFLFLLIFKVLLRGLAWVGGLNPLDLDFPIESWGKRIWTRVMLGTTKKFTNLIITWYVVSCEWQRYRFTILSPPLTTIHVISFGLFHPCDKFWTFFVPLTSSFAPTKHQQSSCPLVVNKSTTLTKVLKIKEKRQRKKKHEWGWGWWLRSYLPKISVDNNGKGDLFLVYWVEKSESESIL